MINKIPNHYNSKYFSWQKNIGNFGAKANKFKFINGRLTINLFQSLALMYSISFAEYMAIWQEIGFK